jgi:hypothetical protein
MRRHLPARRQPDLQPPPAPPVGLPLDSLELRDAIVGEGLVMHETSDGGFEIHLVLAGTAQRLGWFPDAARRHRPPPGRVDQRPCRCRSGPRALAPIARHNEPVVNARVR